VTKGKKILVWAVSVIIVLVLLLFAAVKIFFPADRVQELIVRNIEKSLNRPVTVGKASVTIWGGIGLKLEDLTVRNRPGFARDNFFTLEDLNVRLKFWPLLSGKMEFGSIALNALTVNLEKSPEGILNFADLGEHETEARETEEIDAAKGATTVPFLFDKLQVSNSQINYYDDSSGYVLTLDGCGLSSRLARNDYDEAIYAEGEMAIAEILFRDQTRQLDFPQLDFSAEMKMRLDSKTEVLEIEKINLNLAQLQGQMDGRITSIMSAPVCDLAFRTKKFNPEQLLSLLPPEIYSQLGELKGNGDLFASASLKGDLNDQSKLDFAGKLAFDKVSLNSSRIEGDIEIEMAEINFSQKAANLLFENCLFAGEPVSIRLYIKDIFNPVISGDIALSLNLRSFRNFSDQIERLSGRVNAALNVYSDIKKPEATTLDGGLVIEDLTLTHAKLKQPIEEIDLECEFKKQDIILDKCEAEIGRSKFALNATMKKILPLLTAPDSRNSHPDITFTLNSSYLNLDELAALIPVDTSAIRTEDKIPAGEDTAAVKAVSGQALPDITARGDLSIARGLYSMVEFENFRGRLDYRDNVLHLEKVQADLYGGKAQADVIVDYENLIQPQFSLDFDAQDIEINDYLSRTTGLKDILYGKTRMSSSFSGTMGDPAEVLNMLTANGWAEIDEGHIKNLPLLKTIIEKLGFKTFEEENIRDLKNSFRIENGKVKFDDFTMSLAKANWDISGAVGFDGSLDYDIAVLVNKSSLTSSGVLSDLGSLLGKGDSKLSIPIKLTGNYHDPILQIDRSKLLESADKKLEEEGKKLLQDLFKKKD
jgi:uncharacterized protein involved in outer membrane biogenesis